MEKLIFIVYCITVPLCVSPAVTNELITCHNTGRFLTDLPTPEFAAPINTFCGGVALSFDVSNATVGASTEVYRSVTKDGAFHHRYSLSPGTNTFSEGNVKPRTSYYYTLRSVMEGDASGFSDTLELTTSRIEL